MSEPSLMANASDKMEMHSFELPQNYSILINRLEQLALGLDSAFANLSHNNHEVQGSSVFGGASDGHTFNSQSTEPGYSRVLSDIWIGAVLALLVVTVIFFLCSCFLYHKFQEWKSAYRTQNENIDLCRHYNPEYEGESLPSYTIVSGLPTYDDALEQFRKAGIILAPYANAPTIKIIDNDAASKEKDDDNISVTSSCTCGGADNNTSPPTLGAPLTVGGSANNASGNGASPHVIELTPEQLEDLSKKNLSLQINFPNNPVPVPAPVRRSSRPRLDLRREVLRSRGVGNPAMDAAAPQIHRSRSSSIGSVGSLVMERSLFGRRLQYMKHRGSLV